MKPISNRQTFKAQQHGIALIFVLLMLAIAMGIVIAVAHSTLSGSKASRNDRDRQIAFQSAEQALNDAELDLMDVNLTSRAVKNQGVTTGRACIIGFPFPKKAPSLDFAEVDPGCHTKLEGYQHGICVLDGSATATPAYKMIDWTLAESDDLRQYVVFGEFTGRSGQLSTNTGIAPAMKPRYIIVKAPPLKSNGSAAFKIYALGFGANKNTQVMLESEIYKPGFEKNCN